MTEPNTANVAAADLPTATDLEAVRVQVRLAIDQQRHLVAFRFALVPCEADVEAILAHAGTDTLDALVRLAEVEQALTMAIERHAELRSVFSTRPPLRLVASLTTQQQTKE